MSFWLFKSEPDVFGIDDLARSPEQIASWEGVRNYQARNFLRDQVKLNDRVFIYHSSCKNIGIAGVAKVVREAYPDTSQFDKHSDYYDAKATLDKPRWFMVDVQFEEKFPRVLSLACIKKMPQITQLGIVKKGHRLSVMPVVSDEWQCLVTRARLADG